ncbi:BFH_collapsed_G0039690.mRNA.1.CDS.1 [Saccharomyces cerevisiae]|nr:BFH_HP2_G0038710.mRNA.1.CDS.1 [Saccharomyces cerevisiae]CAI6674256.1 BFH_HP2_G0038710.mRNA.1.CDS.1 [Saccharomyces cerevisiae]CAI6686860.1 BFH_HP1_G0039110.mRNA.1.CDS.1 [Saccharomyces cerevisiae]CAI7260078.1 BFH_collapsed_G0039690.mRNA.1.CDS.1 [Saccharomyces cerevisiae]
MVLAKQWVLKNLPTPGEPFNFHFHDPACTFELIEKELSSEQLKDGELLLETTYLSNDPAQKFWISSMDKNYAKGVQPGEIIPARGIGKVLASRNKAFSLGDYVSAVTGWTTHAIISQENVQGLRKLDKNKVGKLWWYLSVLGGTSLTAYFIFFTYAQLQEREEDYGKVYLISGAAGAVGTVCIQLALNVFKASKVIAIAGGPEKVAFVESFGDNVVGVDYKDPSFKQKLIEAAGGENTVDYFIDNVGSNVLEAGVLLLKQRAMLIACGAISAYNDPSKFVFKGYSFILTKRLVVKGVLVTDNIDDFPKALDKLGSLVKHGKIDLLKSATLEDGTGDKFKNVPLIWKGLFSGVNKGKLITKVNNEE